LYYVVKFEWVIWVPLRGGNKTPENVLIGNILIQLTCMCGMLQVKKISHLYIYSLFPYQKKEDIFSPGKSFIHVLNYYEGPSHPSILEENCEKSF